MSYRVLNLKYWNKKKVNLPVKGHLVAVDDWGVHSIMDPEVVTNSKRIFQDIFQSYNTIVKWQIESFIWRPKGDTVLFHPLIDPTIAEQTLQFNFRYGS